MDHVAFDTLTRRASLLTFSAAGMAAFIDPIAAGAKKNKGKNKRNNGDADNLKLCKKQVGQCLEFFEPRCAGNLACLARVEFCCPELGQCDLNDFFLCINEEASTAALVGPQFAP
jgi:hypothetical protein